ncbi:CBS domain-containing protein [Risungbinella massiliensis]|uniref:CBS domain-containing protein n=1 Tax=Risungbinella massiliensis TaxID=1329796 RepID=UPI0005CC62B5|nr:CBS domain-containing protein [Risungbinella massiliensis]
MGPNVGELMSQDLYFLTPDDTIFEAAVMMKQHDIGIVPICEEGKVTGVVTDRDLVLRGIADKKPNSGRLQEVMSQNLIFAAPEMDLMEAAEIMAEAQIRRLPVVQENQLIGMLSIGDLATEEMSDQKAGGALSEISVRKHEHFDTNNVM